MTLQVRVEAHGSTARTERRDEPQVVEQPERPVDGVQGRGRQPPSNPSEDRLGVGMIEAPGDLTEDLEALVRQLDPCVLDRGLEDLDPTLDLVDGDCVLQGGLLFQNSV